MCRSVRIQLGVVKCLTLLVGFLGLMSMGSAQAFVAPSTCQSQLLMSFPNDDNLNRIVTQHLVINIDITAGAMENQGVPDFQAFSTLHFFPSCLSQTIAGCNVDQGATTGPPPPVEFVEFSGTNCPIVPSVDDSDPFDVKLNFNPALTMDHPNATCRVQFEVQISEAGDPGDTPANIQQMATLEGTCGSGLTSVGFTSTEITLTCPDCDDLNVCTRDTCTGPNRGDCAHSTPPNCDDGNVCTLDQCTGPNPGDCSHTPPPDCDDHNVCTRDTCTGPNPGDCAHSAPPNCDDGNVCTLDQCIGPNPGDCSYSTPPDYCDDGNPCTVDACCPVFQCCHYPGPNCDDGNVCTIDACTGPGPTDCYHSLPPNCDDGNVCTIDTCTGPNPGSCAHSAPPNCDDGNICTTDACTGPNPGDCTHSTPPPCDDDDVCTVDSCTGPRPEYCLHSVRPNCDDGNVCTIDQCTGPGPSDCSHSLPPNCDDGNVCTVDACTGPTPGNCSHVPSPLAQTCGTSDACVDRGCDPAGGCFEHDRSSECGSSETCVERGCDPATGCFERDPQPLPPECTEPQPGCRITAGGTTPDGNVDSAEFADSLDARFGGQVDSPCGCIGCSDSLNQVRGSWETSRKTRRGSFHALNFDSMICGCDGVLDGKLCNRDDGDLGPEPGSAHANVACFSGIGSFNPTHGKRDIQVAFRVEVEDRGESGPTQDVYRVRIWIPGKDETSEGLADQVCCTHASPTDRDPDIDDGGNLIHGDIKIDPSRSTAGGTCPAPGRSCQGS